MTRAKTKLITTLLAVTTAFSLTACAKKKDINKAVQPLSEQITQIDGYIDTLESKVATLETDLTAVTAALEALEENSATKTTLLETKTALEKEINAIKADIQALKDKDSAFTSELSALDGRLTALDSTVSALSASVTALQTQVEENTSKIEELEIRINCLEGNHVVDENQAVQLYYTWSEDNPTSTIKGLCVHCGLACENSFNVSDWQAGDTVIYVAKNGKEYSCEVTGLSGNNQVLLTKEPEIFTMSGSTELNALRTTQLEAVGAARYPRYNDVEWSKYESYVKASVPRSSGYDYYLSPGMTEDSENCWYRHAYAGHVGESIYPEYNKQAYFYYVFEVPVS